jgi:hypothetical protein
MAAHQGVTGGIPSKNVLPGGKTPASEPQPLQPEKQSAEDTLNMESVLPQSLEASAELQQKMGISALSTEDFQRAVSQGLVDWKVIQQRGKEENIRLVAYGLWENGHGNDAENWARAENLINAIWDKIVSHVNTATELNNYLNEHQAELKILL